MGCRPLTDCSDNNLQYLRDKHGLMSGLLHLVQRGEAWVGFDPAQSPSPYTKCNNPPINGQCTNCIIRRGTIITSAL